VLNKLLGDHFRQHFQDARAGRREPTELELILGSPFYNDSITDDAAHLGRYVELTASKLNQHYIERAGRSLSAHTTPRQMLDCREMLSTELHIDSKAPFGGMVNRLDIYLAHLGYDDACRRVELLCLELAVSEIRPRTRIVLLARAAAFAEFRRLVIRSSQPVPEFETALSNIANSSRGRLQMTTMQTLNMLVACSQSLDDDSALWAENLIYGDEGDTS
jgi:hypothetical protein